MEPAEVVQLEQVTRDAWPADETVAYGGWLLRAHQGVTRRANSVWTAAPEPDGWEHAAAEFYGSRRLPVRLQLGDASPAGLDQRLAAAGWVAEAATAVLTAPCASIRTATTRLETAAVYVSVAEQLTPAWLEAYLRLEGHAEAGAGAYGRILGRVNGRYASASVGDEIVAVGLGTHDRGWLGLSCLITDEGYRGKGVATALILALADSGPSERAWLQVMEVNDAARRLYGRLGFERAYGYHYRTRPH